MRKIVIGVLVLILTASIGATTVSSVNGKSSPKLFEYLTRASVLGSGTLGTGTLDIAQIYVVQNPLSSPTFVAGGAVFHLPGNPSLDIFLVIKSITFQPNGCEVSLTDNANANEVALESISGNCVPTDSNAHAVAITCTITEFLHPIFVGTGTGTIQSIQIAHEGF